MEDDDLWTHDIPLFDGTFHYYRNRIQPVRAKVHVSTEQYWSGEHELIPLSQRHGQRSYVMMHPYVLEPNVVLAVGLYPKPKHYADQAEAIGETTGKPRVAGVRDVQVGNAQAWYYPDDNVLVVWECFLESFVRDRPLKNDENMVRLWTAFEAWLVKRYPQAQRIVTPWADPIWNPAEYQSFLRARGYNQHTAGSFVKVIK